MKLNIFNNEKTNYKVPIIDLFKPEKLATVMAVAAISIFALVVGFFSLYLPTYYSIKSHRK